MGRGPMHSLVMTKGVTSTSDPVDKNCNFHYLTGHKGTIFVYKSITQSDDEQELKF